MAKYGPRAGKPGMVVDDAELRKKRLWNAADLARFGDLVWEFPGMFARKQVVMISGPKSSLKSYLLLSAGLSIVYGLSAWDGTKLTPGMFIYVTGEDEKRVGRRRIAWLRAHNLPETDQDGFRVVNVKQDAYRKPNDGKKNSGPSDRLNLLDEESVKALIADLKATKDAEGTRVSIVAFDTLTSLLPKLTDEVCRPLVKHLKMIAEELDCCVVIVNHTHRKSSTTHQGSHVLADSIDGDMIAMRDWEHVTNGVKSGLRTLLHIQRLKDGDSDVTYEWIGTPLLLPTADGGREKTCAMDCLGLTANAQVDSGSVNRVLIATVLAPGKIVNIAELIRLLGWPKKGGSQYEDIREAVPLDEWIAVQLPATGEFRELRRTKVGRNGERVECRVMVEPPQQTEADGKDTKRTDEPEIRAAKQRQKREGNDAAHSGGRPLNSVRRGTMSASDFEIEMETPLAGDDVTSPKQAFDAAIKRLRSAGATITEEGEQVIAYLLALGTSAATMKAMAALFTTSATVHSVLKQGAARMKRESKYRDSKNPPPTPDDAGDGPAPSPGEGE
jgi:KaiC/GvpD/RAD55 family RecA-like ATPase